MKKVLRKFFPNSFLQFYRKYLKKFHGNELLDKKMLKYINFKNGFMNFAYDQKDIGNFYNVYVDLISFWKEIFKDNIYISKYEKLINNSKFEIKNTSTSI